MVEHTTKFEEHSGEKWNPKKFKEIWKDVSNNLFVLTWGLRYFWKRENIIKRLKLKIEACLCNLHLGFKKIQFTFYTYVLAKILQNGAKFRTRKLVSKITRIWTTSDKQWKVQQVQIWLAFVQKNTFLQLKHIQRIYLTLPSTTCV